MGCPHPSANSLNSGFSGSWEGGIIKSHCQQQRCVFKPDDQKCWMLLDSEHLVLLLGRAVQSWPVTLPKESSILAVMARH